MKIVTGLAIFSVGTAAGIMLYKQGVTLMLRDKKFIEDVLGPTVIDNMKKHFGADKTARILEIIAEGNGVNMSEQEAILELEKKCRYKPYGSNDFEVNHINADKILCEFLRSLGYNDLVDAYERIEKEYT
jgi:hypothetical protein